MPNTDFTKATTARCTHCPLALDLARTRDLRLYKYLLFSHVSSAYWWHPCTNLHALKQHPESETPVFTHATISFAEHKQRSFAPSYCANKLGITQ